MIQSQFSLVGYENDWALSSFRRSVISTQGSSTSEQISSPRISTRSAAALVVANMIGAGIFTSTGFQAADLGHPGYIFMLWAVGGFLAFCGALCYAELGAAMPKAGGEYIYLRETFGPGLAFTSVFVSLTAGFSAPIASALKSVVVYLAALAPLVGLQTPESIGGIWADIAAIGLLWALIAIQYFGSRNGYGFNDGVTFLKILGITLIILAALIFGNGDLDHFTYVAPEFSSKTTGGIFSAFATSLIFVMFCYTGWNASAYVANEIQDPQRNLPRSLLWGTALVTLFYIGLNAVYFYGASVDELAGKVEVGVIAARRLFGPEGTYFITAVLSVSILASASAMLIAAPRVYFAFGRDTSLRWLCKRNLRGAPVYAILLQGVAASFIILLGRIDQIQQYAGFTLALFSCLAVLCVLVLRAKHPDLPRPFRVWGYPFTPLLFIAVSVWTMIWAIAGRPAESLLALATVAAGGLLFRVIGRR